MLPVNGSVTQCVLQYFFRYSKWPLLEKMYYPGHISTWQECIFLHYFHWLFDFKLTLITINLSKTDTNVLRSRSSPLKHVHKTSYYLHVKFHAQLLNVSQNTSCLNLTLQNVILYLFEGSYTFSGYLFV